MLSAVASKITYDISLSNIPLVAGYEIVFPFFNSDEINIYITTKSGMATVSGDAFFIEESGLTPVVKFMSTYVFPPESTRLTLARLLTIDQLVDLRNGDVMDAETLEESLDRLTAIAQQLDEQLERCVLIPISESAALTIPPLQSRKDMLLGFDNDGNVVGVLTSDIDQKLSQALAAEENTINVAKDAQQSAVDASESAALADKIRIQALEEVAAANDAVLQAIKEAEDAGLLSLVEHTEALTVELDGIADRIKYSEENANTYAGYARKGAQTATDKALEAKQSADIASGAATDAINEALAAQRAKEAATLSAQEAEQSEQAASESQRKAQANETAAYNNRLAAQTAQAAAEIAKENVDDTYSDAQALYDQMQGVASRIATPTILINGVLYTQECYSIRGRLFEKLTPVTGV